MMDTAVAPFKRIILRALLNDVSPIVARVIAVPDDLEISDLHEVFLSIFGWAYNPGFIIWIHAQAFNSFLSLLDPRLFDALQQTPGRMNLFNLGHYHVLVDYAHKPAGYEAVGSFVKNWSGPVIGVVGGPGDRRDEDLIELGALSATFFDQIIAKEDDDTRGRPRGNAAELIVQGIQQVALDADIPVPHSIKLDETEAIEWALDHAPENALVVIFSENVSRALVLVMSRNPIPDGTEAAFSPESKQNNWHGLKESHTVGKAKKPLIAMAKTP